MRMWIFLILIIFIIRFSVIDFIYVTFAGYLEIFVVFQHQYLRCKATRCKEKNILVYPIAPRLYVPNRSSPSIPVLEIRSIKNAKIGILPTFFVCVSPIPQHVEFSNDDRSINFYPIFVFSTESDSRDHFGSTDTFGSSKFDNRFFGYFTLHWEKTGFWTFPESGAEFRFVDNEILVETQTTIHRWKEEDFLRPTI